MSFGRVLGRRAKLGLFAQDADVCRLLFAYRSSQHACRLLFVELKRRDGLSRAELSRFASDLEAGRVEPGFRFWRTSFYRQVRKTLLGLGLIAIEYRSCDVARKGMVEKYVPVRQPIAQRPPDGLNLVRLTWMACKSWNDEFFSGPPVAAVACVDVSVEEAKKWRH